MSRFAVEPAKPIQTPSNSLSRADTEDLYNSDGWNSQFLVPFNSECPFILAENSTSTVAFPRVRKSFHLSQYLGLRQLGRLQEWKCQK